MCSTDPSSKVTVGAAFMSHPVALPDGATVKFEIWDTAGQERYASLAPLYYRGAVAAILVFAITDEASFEKLKEWVRELQNNAQNKRPLEELGIQKQSANDRKKPNNKPEPVPTLSSEPQEPVPFASDYKKLALLHLIEAKQHQ